jgi:dTMP kinase
MLEKELLSLGKKVTVVREPGGTILSEQIRSILLSSETAVLDPWSELCLYEAARSQLLREVVRPALAEDQVVLADRFADASLAYQGGGRRLGLTQVRALNRLVTGGLQPLRTFLLDLDPEVGLARIRRGRGDGALDRLESEPISFHRLVRRTYLRVARSDPARFRVLDATVRPDEIARQIQDDVYKLL